MEGVRESSHLWAPGPNWKALVSNASLVSTTETTRGRHSHGTDWQPQENTTGIILTCLASSFPLIPSPSVREWNNKSGVRTQRCFSLTRPDSSLGISEAHCKKPTPKGDCFHLRQLVTIPLGSVWTLDHFYFVFKPCSFPEEMLCGWKEEITSFNQTPWQVSSWSFWFSVSLSQVRLP